MAAEESARHGGSVVAVEMVIGGGKVTVPCRGCLKPAVKGSVLGMRRPLCAGCTWLGLGYVVLEPGYQSIGPLGWSLRA